MNRRDWLIASAASAALPAPACLAQAVAFERLDDQFALLTGLGGNVLVFQGSTGLVLVDSGNSAGADLQSALMQIDAAAAVDTLINTHWHPDQTTGNAQLGEAGARIVAHAKTKQYLAVGYYRPEQAGYVPPAPESAVPQQTFYTTTSIETVGTVIDCGYLLEAHTDGDIYAHFREANLIAAGDAISPLRDPQFDWFGGGWIGGRLDALQLLLDLADDDTRFVPSFGPVVGRDYVARELAMLTTVFDRMFEFVRQGMSAQDCIEAGAMAELDREFDDPFGFIDATHRSLWAHHNTLSHDIV